MTLDDLAAQLTRLDPGSVLTVPAPALAETFGTVSLSREAVQQIEAFALEHRCTFAYDEAGRATPCFEKDDIF